MPINLNHTAEDLRLIRDPKNTTRHRQDYDDKFKYDRAGIRPHHIDDIVKAIYEDLDILANAEASPNLTDLGDVVITSAQLNDILTWNGTEWVNQPAPASTVITQLDPVISAQTTPPVSVTLGDRYLITATATGAWVGKEKKIAEWNGGSWDYTTPVTDNTVYVTNTLTTYRYNGTAWVQFQGTSILNNGNSVGNTLNIGTNDSFDVILKRNALERLRLTSTGVKINNLYSLPTTDGANGQVIITDGSGTTSWGTVNSLPNQSTHAGQYLTTNGTTASWATVDSLPTQTGNNGKFLTTDGSNASWATVDLSGYVSTSGSYSNPTWITSLAYSKLTGAPTTVSTFTNDSGYITSSALSPYLTSATAASTYQPLDATLTALAGLSTGSNKIPYSTGTDTFSQLDFSTSTSLGTSDTTIPSQKAIKTYADTVASSATKLFNYYNFI